MAQPYKFTSHEAFSHDSLDSLGYDWERVANPAIAPKYPWKIYLPRSTADIVQAVCECRDLNQKLIVRSKGHSSNDLVLAERGTILCTEKLDQIVAVDDSGLSVTVQSGVVLAELDSYLAERGLGLPIIGDHNHITAGGFASVGGISPASHRHGMFIDNVRSLEYVNAGGEVIRCNRDERPDEFYRVLCGCGQHGVVATLTLGLVRVDKFGHILRNERKLFKDVRRFIDESERRIQDPGDAFMERGVWLDYLVMNRSIGAGQFSSYYETPQSRWKSLRNRASYRYLHGLGEMAGRLPTGLDVAVKYLGMVGVMFSPSYASIKNVEGFTDRILDSSVGDPTRMFIVLAPVEEYAGLFSRLYELFRAVRAESGCFTFISIYVKAIRSAYLSFRNEGRFSELMFYCGVRPEKLTGAVLEELVSKIDDACIEVGALRYMHSKTVSDAERRRQIDPNAVRAAASRTPDVESAAKTATGGRKRKDRSGAVPETR